MVMPKAYEGNEPYIFISYAHKDSEKVLPIIQALQDRGFRVWYDAGIEAGTEWPEYIAEHLDGCACFLAFISQSALDSHNCRREINFAIELRKDPLAVYLEDVKLSLGMRMQLGTLQAMFYNRHNGMDSFMDALAVCELLKPCKGELPAPAPKPTPKPVPKPMSAAAHASATEVSCLICGTRYASAAKECPLCKFPTLEIMPEEERNELTVRKTPEEMAELGLEHYRSGNYSEAVSWFQKAKEAGNVDGTFYLACCYAEGKGVPQDFIQAMALYWSLPSNTKTYMYKNPDSKVLFVEEAIVQWYIDTLQRTKKYTKNQIHAFLQKFAEKGDDLKVSLLAYHFNAKRLYAAAFILDYALADRDRSRAFPVAMSYHFGHGVAQNSNEAIKWYLKHKDFNSCSMLAVMYEEGHGVKKNWFEAQKWWNEYKKLGGKSADIQFCRDHCRILAEQKEWIL